MVIFHSYVSLPEGTPKMGGFDAQKRPEMLGPGIPDLIKALWKKYCEFRCVVARIGIRSIKNAWIIWRNTSSFNARTENIQNALCVCVCVGVVILILHSSSSNKTYAVCVVWVMHIYI